MGASSSKVLHGESSGDFWTDFATGFRAPFLDAAALGGDVVHTGASGVLGFDSKWLLYGGAFVAVLWLLK